MKKIAISLFILYLLSSNIYLKDDNNEIEWCSKRKLIWNDFTGKPDTINTSLVVASTQSRIKITKNSLENGVRKIEVKSFFVKDKSWKVVDDLATLQHEQLHFDICEIYARKIRKKFDSLNKNKIISIELYQKVYDSLIEENIKYNELYDSKVYFNEEKQKQWFLKIAKELEELKAYEIKCSCNK